MLQQNRFVLRRRAAESPPTGLMTEAAREFTLLGRLRCLESASLQPSPAD